MTTTFTTAQLKEFEKEQWTLAVFAPCDKSWEELKKAPGIKINPFLKSAVFRVLFAFVCFLFVIPRIAIGEKIKLSNDGEKRSGYQLAQIFAKRRSFNAQPQVVVNPPPAQIPVQPPTTPPTTPPTIPPTIPPSNTLQAQPPTQDPTRPSAQSQPFTSQSLVKSKGGVEASGLALRSGLDNLGNTCYINACIQLIASIPAISHELLTSGRDIPLRTALVNLVEALKDSSSTQGEIGSLNKIFYNILMGTEWNSGDRAGWGRMNDTFDLLLFLSHELGVDMRNVSSITSEKSYIEVNFLTKKVLGTLQIEKSDDLSEAFRLPRDRGNKTIQQLITDEMGVREVKLYSRKINSSEIGSEVVERAVLLHTVNALDEPNRANLLKQFYDKNGNLYSENHFSQGKEKHETIIKALGMDYDTILNNYCRSKEAAGEYEFIQRDQLSTEELTKGSQGFFVSIENPTSTFKPDREVKIGGDTFRLQAVVRRNNTPHYMLCEISEDGRSGVKYSDGHVEKGIETSWARHLYYQKVV